MAPRNSKIGIRLLMAIYMTYLWLPLNEWNAQAKQPLLGSNTPQLQNLMLFGTNTVQGPIVNGDSNKVNNIFNIQNYFSPVSNSVTHEAFDSLQSIVTNATNKIEFTGEQIRLIAQALRDLDQRTSDIEVTRRPHDVWGICCGNAKGRYKNFETGRDDFIAKNFQSGFEHFQAGITAMESTESKLPKNTGMFMGEISASGKALMYAGAAYCAMQMTNFDVGKVFAEKAFSLDRQTQYKVLIVDSLGDLAIMGLKNNDVEGAFVSIQSAVSNYESIGATPETNHMAPKEVEHLYHLASSIAGMLGKQAEADDYAKRADRITAK